MTARLVPAWTRGYRRSWLRDDLVAGVVIWSVVTPQAVAYAQIAGLPPEAGLMAAPPAMIGYALLGTSHQLVVSATTATAAVSAATVGSLADGDPARFAALSAALALVVAVVLVVAGLLRLGALADLVSTPVMTGFLFGLGLTIIVAQLPALIGVAGANGDFFPRVADLARELGGTHGATIAVGAASVALLLAGRALAPRRPTMFAVLTAAIVASALLDLDEHGVAVVGHLPDALPKPAVPDVSAGDLVDLLTPALGVLVLSAEAVGVARGLAAAHGYRADPDRDLVAMGASNALAGLGSGFVQSGGASQTAAADGAGARSQLAGLVCAGLLLLTGAFLAGLFEPLPQATLAAIVIVAVGGFLRVGELRRFARVRPSALGFALLTLAGVLVLGVLEGLVVAAGLSLAALVQRLMRPTVGPLVTDPSSGAWGLAERHPGWKAPGDVLAIGSDAPLLYPNANKLKERVLTLVDAGAQRPRAVVLALQQTTDLDLESVDVVGELADALRRDGIELRLAGVRVPALRMLQRSGVADRVRLFTSLAEAVAEEPRRP